MNKEQLAQILDQHAKWLRGEGDARGNLRGANLIRADLIRADLTRADLIRANLTGANLTGANLTGASLTRANLTGANLTGADLTEANLTGANLTRANLTGISAAHNRYVITACLTNYQMVLFQHKGTVLVTAGCHRGWTIERALAHWMPENQGKWTENTPEYGQRQIAMLSFLVEQAKALGWPVE